MLEKVENCGAAASLVAAAFGVSEVGGFSYNAVLAV